MFKQKPSVIYYSLAVVLFLIYIILSFNQQHDWAGILLMLFFGSLAMAFRSHPFLKTISFTVIIFAAVSMALYYPQYFLEWGGFKLSGLIIPLIQVIMFGMGTSMSVKDFAAVVKTPKGVIIGVMSQFTIMPLLGFSLASFTNFEPEIAAGIVLIGCAPSGLASNVMAYLAKANLALSLTITSITTLIAPVVTPMLMKILAGALVEIDVFKMMWDISKMIIIPIGAGLIFNKLLSGKSKWVDDAMPFVSMAGIACILIVITSAGRENLLKIGPALIGVVLIHNLFGYFLGYWSGRLFKLPESDCRTIAIEVGMQNAGLASGIAKEMGKIATIGLAPAVFGPLMNITGSTLASWWHSRLPKYTLLCFILLSCCLSAKSQQISKEDLIFLTPEWKGERFADGRPKVPDNLLDRLKLVTHEEAWAVLRNENFKHQYADGWQMINPDSVLVGRAVTAIFMPGRPDIHRVIDNKGHTKDGRVKSQNSWPIDMLVKRDVYVVDQFGAHEDGPTIGDNLGNSIYAKSGNGIVYDGAIRDISGLRDIGSFTSFFRSYHPSHHLNNPDGQLNTTLIGINQPTRIGKATVMPGDAVLGRDGGVIFIPPHLLEKVVKTSEIVRLRDMFGHERLREQKYTPGQIDTKWSDEIEKDFSKWLTAHIDKLPVSKEQIQEYLKSRTW